jgi:glycine cleavage system H protein
MKRFTEEHEWVTIEGNVATIGITVHAANELGDITFVELPEVGATVDQGDVLLSVESVKAASDVYSPVTGTVTEVNEALEESPEMVNDSAEVAGWICKLSVNSAEELNELLSEDEYQSFIS